MSTEASLADRVLEGLDAEQRAVATSFGRPVVVLAGAGTGKTRAITHRIAYGAATGALQARHTLAVTFTSKAAAELRHRLAGLGVPRVQARTFHAAALRQLSYFWPRVNGVELPPVANGTFGLIAEAARALPVSIETPLLRDLAAEISWAKVSNVPSERYIELAAKARREVDGLDAEQVASVLLRYEQVKKHRGVIDFDDILLCAIALLHEHPEVADEVRDQYRHFTVDEYQDVSPIQRTLLELWLGERSDICVVGDPNQAIHTFAGAQPAYLTGFTRDHPDAFTLKLRTNYRSTPQVLDAANALIGRDARLRATRDAGPDVEVIPASDEQTEAAATVAWLVDHHRAGMAWNQSAVLYRINAQSEALVDELRAAKVPYAVRDAEHQDRSDDAVTLSTIHSAKGLEWEAVAMIGLSDGLLPFIMADTPAAIAEEKRLLYVGLTRARTELRLSWAQGGTVGRGRREPSRFLRAAGLVEPASAAGPRTKGVRTRKPRTLPSCHVCGKALSDAVEIKLGRHTDCVADFDEQLFDALREWRWEEAQTQSVPAFVVFTDATLRALAEQRPEELANLTKIPGIGPAKCERYGNQIIEVIADHASD
ncbi:ATP-dependent DNA helicase UvrD2 [Brooklawnia sp.]|uniref:ATP-dependent DNA helicase UvrD2 n=1 Tax=Brooklawnia sp. TaxID=2699740 RepID=UPI00311F8CAD